MLPIKESKPKASTFTLNPRITSIISFFVLVFIGFFIIKQQHSISEQKEKLEMQKILHIVQRNIEHIIQNGYTVTLTLAQTVNKEGVPEDFDSVSKKLLENNKNINVVQLVPDGVIKYIYPTKGNEAAIGLNLFTTDYTRDEAYKAISRKDIYFAGPLNLVQGGKAIVGRLPVYRNGKFWGFSAVIIKLDNLLQDSGLVNFNNKGYYAQLSKINPQTGREEFFLDNPTSFQNSITETINMSEGNWKVYLVKESDASAFVSLYPTIILWTIFCIFSTILLYFLLKKPSELQKVIVNQDEQISKNENELQAIFDNAALGIAVIDVATRKFIKVNLQLCKILESPEAYLENTTIHEFVHPEDTASLENSLLELKSGNLTRFSATKKLTSRSQKLIWANIAVSPMWHTHEEPTSYVVVLEDITEKKKAAEQLKESESRFKSLFEDSPIPLQEEDLSEVQKELQSLQICDLPSTKIYRYFKTNPDQLYNCVSKIRIINVNKETLKLKSAGSKQELLNRFNDLIASNSQNSLIKQLIAICKNQTSFSGETRILTIRKEQKDVQIKWYVVPGYESNYKRVFVSTEDITERKNAVRELKSSHKILIERNKRLLEFSYIISHNLRSHTSNIQTIIANLSFTDTEEERHELLVLLKEVSDSLDETIHNLNEITSIRTNLDVSREPLKMYDLIEKTIAILSSKIKKTNAVINNKIKPDLIINYNAAYLESILLNLISNAIKYAHEERNPEVTITAKYYRGNLRLYVSDNGIGIDLKKHGQKIFGMYKTFTNRPDSKGIGLFITKNQIETMGGKIEVESELNVGTTFKVYFDEA